MSNAERPHGPRGGLLVLGAVVVLDVIAMFASRRVGAGLAAVAAVVCIVWLVRLLTAYGFPWPWRNR